jgi:hypothetical protein
MMKQMEPVSESGLVFKKTDHGQEFRRVVLALTIIKSLHTVQFYVFTSEGILMMVMKFTCQSELWWSLC